MAGVVAISEQGPDTFVVTEAVLGGQLVEARTGSKIGVAAAASVACLGIATKDAITPAAQATAQTVAPTYGSSPGFDVSVISENVAVGYHGVWPVKYAAAATFGALLKVAALGTVTPWVFGTDNPSLIVARCVEPAGVSGASVIAATRLLLG